MIVLLSDTHLGLQKSSDLWHEVTLNLFQEIRDFCIRNNIDTILHLGDFFHERKSTNTKSLDMAYEIVSMLDPIKMVIITGNHDSFYKDKVKPTSLQSLEKYNNINIIYENLYVEEISSLLVPWVYDNIEAPRECKYCFGHFSIEGFSMNNHFKCTKGSSASMFSQFEHVYSGHFHTPSSNTNITYIGSPFQQNFNDINSNRGYYTFDNGQLEFIEYTSAPKFIKQHTEKKFSDIEGNIVQLIYDKDYGVSKNTKILDEVMRMNPLKISTNFTNISEEDEQPTEMTSDMLDHKDITMEYIQKDKIPDHLNKKILKEMAMKIMEG